MKRNVLEEAVLELRLNDLVTGFEDTYVQDISTIPMKQLDYVESLYTNDELTILLMAYCIKKKKAGKQAYCSKFVKKLCKKGK